MLGPSFRFPICNHFHQAFGAGIVHRDIETAKPCGPITGLILPIGLGMWWFLYKLADRFGQLA
jgi:hypothetical protein